VGGLAGRGAGRGLGFAVWWVVIVSVVGEADAAVGEFGERRVEHNAPDAVLVDVYRGEEGLVEGPAGALIGADVQAVAVLQQAESDGQSFLEQGVVDAGQIEQPLGFPLLDGDGFLTRLEIGRGDGFGQVGVDQLLALFLQPLQPPSLAVAQLLVLPAHPRHLLLRGVAHRLDQFRGEPPGAPVLHQLLLQPFGREVRHVALGALLDPAQAEEVRVGAAATLGVAEAQPRVALSTEQAALEIVLVTPGTVAGQPPPGQHVLHPLPSLDID
jgi:hypothetical protein